MTYDIQPCTACEAPIIFAVSASTRSMMPINAMPAADGNISLRPGPTDAPVATVLSPAKRFGLTGLRTSHFVTCPRASKFRKRGKA